MPNARIAGLALLAPIAWLFVLAALITAPSYAGAQEVLGNVPTFRVAQRIKVRFCEAPEAAGIDVIITPSEILDEDGFPLDTNPGVEIEGELPEVELDCDYQLKYEHVMRAITAISGYIDPDTGRVIRVIEKIKFAPPRGG